VSNILILYSSVEGQTARIAQRMAQTLRNLGHGANTRAATKGEGGLDPTKYDGVIVGASVHNGRHPASLRSLLRDCRLALEARPNAFFSVSLSGGGPGAKPAAAQRYATRFLREVGWQPQQTAIFGGALAFSKYALWKRALMKIFVGLAGGDTDASRDYEYTDWNAVERFAEAFAMRLKKL